VNVWNAINALSQPFISVNSFPRSVSSSSTFGVSWSILGPTGLSVTDTHVVWGTVSGRLSNSTAAQSGQTHQSYTANGFSMPADAAPAELLCSSGTAVGAPTRPGSGSNRRSANRAADHESADLRSDHPTRPTGCPGDGGAAHGCQEALPELRDDGQRGQHVLLLLREPIPLSRNTIGPLLTRTDYVPPSRGMPRAPYVRCL